jgi:hypothetical protein
MAPKKKAHDMTTEDVLKRVFRKTPKQLKKLIDKQLAKPKRKS